VKHIRFYAGSANDCFADTAWPLTYVRFKIYKPAMATYPKTGHTKSLFRVGVRKFLKNFASKFKHLSLQPITRLFNRQTYF